MLVLDADGDAHLHLRLAIVGPEQLGITFITSFHHTVDGRRAIGKVGPADTT